MCPQVATGIQRVFAFCYVWAMGGNLTHTVQDEFDEFVREQLASVCNFPGEGFRALGLGVTIHARLCLGPPAPPSLRLGDAPKIPCGRRR